MVVAVSACKDPDPPTPDPSQFQLDFAFKWGSSTLERDQFYPAPDGRDYAIHTLKYYVSNLSLVKPDQTKVPVKDVALVDIYYPASQAIAGEVSAGDYTGIAFSLGLSPAQNLSNPADYPVEHPLSSVNNMFWNWATKYIFAKVEGTADTTGADSLDIMFLYHPGADSMRQDLEFSGLDIQVAEGQTQKHILTLDLQQVIFGAADTIDVRVDPVTHTTNDPALAGRVMRNFKAAIH